MYKVSVVVPIYGVERYIERCARSLFEQTLSDIEYIFVNDCTPDDSMVILSRIIEEYKLENVNIINHPENRGLPAARQSGIAVATGEYIVNCDSDDWLEATYCEHLYEKAIQDSADMVVCNYWYCYDDRKEPAYWFCNPNLCTGPDSFRLFLAMILDPAVWIKCIRREILQRKDFFYSNYYSSEDWIMTVQMALYASKISYLDERLYNYYVGNNTISRSGNVDIKIKNFIQQVDNIKLVCQWLSAKKIKRNYWPEIIFRKLNAKDGLVYQMSAEDFKKHYWIWFSKFWTTNFLFLFNKYYNFSDKKHYIKRMLGRI